ncbi:MAG: outer membrane beta-barrel protein [Opitutus sp.]
MEYSTRTDDYVEGLVAVSYNLNAMVNFGASYTYRNNNSDQAAAEFTNSVFSLGANIRY